MAQLSLGRFSALAVSPFVRSVGAFMIFTAVGQGIYLVAAPMIGRLFSPGEVGIYGLVLTIVTICAMFVCLYYDHAIPAAASDQEALDLTKACTTLALITCPLVGVMLSGLSTSEALADQIPFWSGPIAAGILFFFAITQLLQAWRVRRNDTTVIAHANLTLNLVRGAGQVGGGLLAPTWWLLLLGELAGRAATMAHMIVHSRDGRVFRIGLGPDVRKTMRKYSEFPLVLLPSQGLDTVAQFLQISGLTVLYGTSALGQYYLMRRTLDLPVAFFFRALGDVFYARQVTEARSAPERIRPFFVKSVLLLALVGFAGSLPLILFGRPMFLLVFGPNWGPAGTMAAIMAPAAVLNLAMAPVSRVFNLSRRPHLRFAFGAANLTGTLAVLALAYAEHFDILRTVAGISITTAAAYLVYFVAGWLAAADIRSPDGTSLNQEEAFV